MPVRSIGIVAWPGRSARLPEAMQRIAEWSRRHPKPKIVALDSLRDICYSLEVASIQKIRTCDVLMAIGGDGTVLSTARIALGGKVAVLGVNTGRIGFLAEYRVEDLEATLDMLFAGTFERCPRIMIDFSIYKGNKKILRDTVLNEVQVQAVEPVRMIDLEVQLNGSHLTEYWADSLLISTPTGSTAYNLSAGGPILHPTTNAFVLNPVNPCSLSVRPLVISADHSELVLQECNGLPLRIVVDGQPGPILEPGCRLVLRKSKWVTHFVQNHQSGFVEALREKLGWTGKPKLKV
jgi:NAD+ kinase